VVTLTRKNKIALTVITLFAIVLIIVFPFVTAETLSSSQNINSKTLKAHGYAFQRIDDQTIKYSQAEITLTIQATSANTTVKRFDITGGAVIINGTSYTIAGGNGAVLAGRRIVLLKASGIGEEGQAVTLKIEGRYFWMWGHLYAARIAAKLQTDNGNYTLFMRASIGKD
jgi:hypothetical protein